MSKKILKDSAIYVIGELFSKIVPFLLLPYLSRKLGLEGFGELSYYQTYLALFAIVIGLSQEGAVARYFYFYGKDDIDIIVRSGYIYSTIVGLFIAGICWLLGSEILFYGALSSLFGVFVAVQLSIRQCQKQSVAYTSIQFASALISSIITITMLEYYQTDLVEKRILAILFANILVFLLAFGIYQKSLETRKVFSISQYKKGLLYVFSFGLPLLLHHGSILVKGQLDRFFIYHRFDDASLGLYAMGANLAMVLSVLIMAVNKATLPYYYEALKQEKITLQQIQKWALLSLLLVPIPSLIIWLIPETVLLWLLGKQFIGTKYFFMLFVLSVMLVIPYLLLVNYLFYFGKNKQIAFCSMLSTMVYLIALSGLVFIKIDYVPFASILGALVILPVLWVMTTKVDVSRGK